MNKEDISGADQINHENCLCESNCEKILQRNAEIKKAIVDSMCKYRVSSCFANEHVENLTYDVSHHI